MAGCVGVSVEPAGNDIFAASEASKKIDDPWGRLLKQRKYKPHLIMAILIPFFQQLSGMNVVMFYAQLFFKTLGFGRRTGLASTVIIGGLAMLTSIVSFYVMKKKGSRFILLGSGVQLALVQFVFGGLVSNKFRVIATAIIGQSYAILVLSCLCQIVAGLAWLWGILGWLVPGKIFPLEVRSAVQSINVYVNMFFTFVNAHIFLKMLYRFKFGLFFFFGGFGIIMNIFVYFFLPETKGIPFEEMSKVWKNHWYWKRFTDDDKLEEKKVPVDMHG